ncbi:MAG: hypothetical protein ACTHJW_23585 [Streptosporangiaceae bacterium]
MTRMSVLERRYRRLLFWYPAEHRSANGDEMIGVLLSSAREGQRRPCLSDVLDLALGGLRIRFRALLGGQFGPSFTDAFAIYSVATPVMWTIIQVAITSVYSYNLVASGTATSAMPGIIAPMSVEVIFLILTIAPLVLAWRGRRAAAVVVALIPAALTTVLALMPQMTTGFGTAESLLTVLLVVALAISPGPRHGADVMSRWTWVVVCAAGLAESVPLYAITSRWMLAGLRVPLFAGIALAAAAAFIVTLPRAVAMRLLVLMAAPVSLAGLAMATAYSSSSWVTFSYQVVYLPALALVLLTGALGWIGRRRRLTPTV